MGEWRSKVIVFFSNPGPVLSLQSIRHEALPYFVGWVVIFTWLYCYFLPNGSLLFSDTTTLARYEHIPTYTWLIVCPLITTFAKAVHYIPKTLFSVMIALVCFMVLLFFEIGSEALILKMVIAACVGHIFATCGYGFFMILNNAEKFYSMVLGILLPKVLMLLNPVISQSLRFIKFSDFILLCCLMVMLVCTVFFHKEKTLIPNVGKAPFPKKAWSLMVMVFLILAFSDVIAPLVLFSMKDSSSQPLELWYFGGIGVGLLMVLLLQKGLKLSICLMLNLSMALLAIGFVIGMVVKDYPIVFLFTAICFGIAYSIGMVNIYYLAGFIAKKLQNITFYRVGIILSAACYFYGYGTVQIFRNTLPVINVLSICVIILFFTLSPIFMRLFYDGEWIDDSYRQDVTFESRLRMKLKDLKLSPKETEVCELLLRGYTLRQTAAMLEIAYPTVNTYCTALYRKLNINSRTELTLLFKEFID